MALKLKHVGLFFIGCVVVPHVYATSFADKAIAVDGITIGGGPESNSEANMHSYRLSVLWDWNQDWLKKSNWLLSGYFDLSFFYWENELNHTDSLSSRGNGSTAGVSFSPIFRIKPRKPFGGWIAPFFEVGIGPSLVTHDEIVAESSSPVDLVHTFS
ncbi:acyloxyacyl hydrolase [Zooshikella harenae]|uniref:Acyloxyacyl hydrolase n=1 Tax=Zooshikella harenae TaxID=2827238 RepID=A0ABS5ZFI6_9GAMM|nr:acyloxyacyl hydrolase [Zooshikella harenae]MBU2712745.1 acyloxyacyl hydrolase [Zooshikella harenae]